MPMRVLAFDPGFERLGVAVVEKVSGVGAGPREKLLYSACVRTDPKLSFEKRLQALGEATQALIQEWQPTVVALEDIYFANNAKTVIRVSEVRGVLSYLAAAHNLPLYNYTPLAVKVAITGYGKSDKKAVSAMVVRVLGLQTKDLKETRRLDDEMDAIAIGLTCLASVRTHIK